MRIFVLLLFASFGYSKPLGYNKEFIINVFDDAMKEFDTQKDEDLLNNMLKQQHQQQQQQQNLNDSKLSLEDSKNMQISYKQPISTQSITHKEKQHQKIQHSQYQSMSLPQLVEQKDKKQDHEDELFNNQGPLTQYNKEFFYLSAPNESFLPEWKDVQYHINRLKKNLRVIFIKSPEQNGLAKAIRQLTDRSIENTSPMAIYILHKQHDANNFVKRFQEEHTNSNHNSKPQVYFVNYKTKADAELTQNKIQAQYDSLKGSNFIDVKRVARIQNFINVTPTNAAKDIRIADLKFNAVNYESSTMQNVIYLPPTIS